REGRWAHAHAGRGRGPLGACPCRPRARDAGGMPMPDEREGRCAHAHAGQVRGTLRGILMSVECEGRRGKFPCRPSARDVGGHALAGRVRGTLGACPCRSSARDADMSLPLACWLLTCAVPAALGIARTICFAARVDTWVGHTSPNIAFDASLCISLKNL
ncbi:hypothetical protein HAX54_044473, partial [Datura stramonium]|nr:hypothetical protein [Datura stramonium]